jgi:hypothetical protein
MRRLPQARSWSQPGLHRAYAARRATGGTITKAWELLLPAFDKFPEITTISYNLACYACQLGQLDEARRWLGEARKRGESKQILEMARRDSDLEALWPELPKR